MLSKEELCGKIKDGLRFLDGATGSNLMLAGMPRGAVTELWVRENPQILQDLQRAYFAAGSQILYAPTFQAQPLPLSRHGLEKETEKINTELVALTRSAAPGVLVAGNLTTLAAFTDSWDADNLDLLVENYRRQIRGLIDGGADLLAAETLMYPTEAEAILIAAELENAGATMYSFTMQPDASLFSGMDACGILKDLEEAGAAAVGFNCVAADDMTPGLVMKLRRFIKGPLLCKPNAGSPVIGADGRARYPMSAADFGKIAAECVRCGADLVGGCCGTTPEHIAQLVKQQA